MQGKATPSRLVDNFGRLAPSGQAAGATGKSCDEGGLGKSERPGTRPGTGRWKGGHDLEGTAGATAILM